MSAVIHQLQNNLQLGTPTKKWNFNEILATKNSDFFQLVVSQHTLMNHEYNVLCTQLIHDYFRKNKDEEQITTQLISALMYAQLLEHIFRLHLNVPREVIRLKKEQKIYQSLLEERGFTFSELAPTPEADAFSQFVRNNIASINWPRLSFIRGKRVLDALVPLLKQFEVYCQAIAVLDALTNPAIAYLSWVFFIPRLSVCLFLLIKHTLPGFWMGNDEKNLGWYIRLQGQLLRRWFEIFNDAAWLIAGLLGCFVLVGKLAPIGAYANLVFFVYDVVLASIRFHLEIGRLNKLKEHYKEQEKELRLKGASKEELDENKRFQKHLNDLINFERIRLLVSVVNTSVLAFAILISVPLIAVNPIIFFIGACILFTSTVSTYFATQIVEKYRPSRDPTKLLTAQAANAKSDKLSAEATPADPLQANLTSSNQFVDVFKQVYQALHNAQTSAFKSKNHWQGTNSCQEDIEKYAKNNSDSRTAYAIELTNNYLQERQVSSEEDAFKKLVTSIYQYGYKHSSSLGLFKQSNNKALINTTSLNNENFKKAFEEAGVETRTYSIYSAFN